MHTALQTSDILGSILNHLRSEKHRWESYADGGIEWEKRTTLLNAALTCQAFLEPALAALWWRIGDIHGLLKLIPPFKVDPKSNQYRLETALTQSDFNRLNMYARHVRHFNYVPEDNLHYLVVLQITMFRGGKPLLPALHSLTITASGSEHLLFLSPTLKQVSIYFGNEGSHQHYPGLLALLQEIYHFVPSLQHLEVWVHACSASLKAIIQLQHLEYLDMKRINVIDGLDFDFVQELGTLPRLKSLVFYTPLFSLRPTPARPSHQPMFPSLESVTYHGSIFVLKKIFQLSKANGIRIIILDPAYLFFRGAIPLCDPPELYFDMFILVGEKFNQSLEVIDVFGRSLSVEDLQPLFEARNIKSASFGNLTSTATDTQADDIAKKMCEGWPKLQTLRLYSNTPEVLVSGLNLFAKRCSHLSELMLCCDFRTLSPGEQPELVSNSAVTLLDVQTSSIENAEAVASYLSRTFLNLKTLSFAPGPNSEKWGQVQTLLSELQREGQRA